MKDVREVSISEVETIRAMWKLTLYDLYFPLCHGDSDLPDNELLDVLVDFNTESDDFLRREESGSTLRNFCDFLFNRFRDEVPTNHEFFHLFEDQHQRFGSDSLELVLHYPHVFFSGLDLTIIEEVREMIVEQMGSHGDEIWEDGLKNIDTYLQYIKRNRRLPYESIPNRNTFIFAQLRNNSVQLSELSEAGVQKLLEIDYPPAMAARLRDY